MDRFKGMTEEEVMKKTLPDLLDYNLDYVIVRSSFYPILHVGEAVFGGTSGVLVTVVASCFVCRLV